MSIPPNRLAEALEELRGDYAEHARQVLIPAQAAAFAGTVPLFVDGRLPLTEAGAPATATTAVVGVGAEAGGNYPVTVTAGTGRNFVAGEATFTPAAGAPTQAYVSAIAGDVLTVQGLPQPPAVGTTITQAGYGGSGGRGDTGGYLWRVLLIPQATVTGQATNFSTLQLVRYNDGVFQANHGNAVAFSAATTSWVAQTPQDLGVIPFQYNPGDVMSLNYASSGTGLAMPALLAVLEVSRLGV